MSLLNIPLDQLRISGDNMRDDVGDLEELAESIKRYGVLQPIVVTPAKGRYEVVCGHRRLAAARRAGLVKIPAVSRIMSEDDRLTLMIVENVHRRSLSPLEEAHAFEKLIKRGMKQNQVAEMIDKSQAYVSRVLQLLKQPEDIQQRVHRYELGLQKAIGYDKHGLRKDRPPDTRDPDQKWQVFYIDRLIRWFEAGRVNIEDDDIFNRLTLLGAALDALASRSDDDSLDGRPEDDVVGGIPMCHDCGSVVGIAVCCDDHPNLFCVKCSAKRHGEDIAS